MRYEIINTINGECLACLMDEPEDIELIDTYKEEMGYNLWEQRDAFI